MTYGASITDMFALLPNVAQILKGRKPADLPV